MTTNLNCLCRFVDYFTIPSYNLTSGTNNLTYHHSRLMGVSDIQNTVSISKLSHIKYLLFSISPLVLCPISALLPPIPYTISSTSSHASSNLWPSPISVTISYPNLPFPIYLPPPVLSHLSITVSYLISFTNSYSISYLRLT